MNKSKTYWFVEPDDAHTNEIIVRQLVLHGGGEESGSLLNIEGKKIAVFSVPDYAFINRLYKDKQKFGLRFNVFCRRGVNGKLKPFKFADAAWKSQRQKIERDLKKILANKK